jgi:preprotein translocase subunit SecA
VDQARVESLHTQRLASFVDEETPPPGEQPGTAGSRGDLVDSLCDQQLNQLRQRRLATLEGDQKKLVFQVLRKEGLASEQGEKRSVSRLRVSELDRAVYRDLLLDLGSDLVEAWDATPFQDLGEEQNALLRAYLGRQIMSRIERRVLLHTISRLWIGYLTDIEDLRRGIGLEAYGQRDPLVEYKRRAFELFEELGNNIRRSVVRSLFQQPPQPLRTQ